MVTAVFLIAILNLGLGFALSALADSRSQQAVAQLLSLRRHRPEQVPVEEPLPEPTDDDESTEEEGCMLKEEWLAILQQAKIDPQSTVESVLWLVYLELPILRACVLPVDKSWWCPESREFLADHLSEEGTTWLGRLEQWAAVLSKHKDEGEILTPLTGRFEELLLDQHFQAKTAQDSLLDRGENAEQSPTEVARELAAIFNSFDKVRDFVSEELSHLLRDDNRLELIDDLRQQDVASGALSRLGLEVVARDWWQEDAERQRLVSCVLVDVDRTARLNETLGADATDRVLPAFGEVMLDFVRKDRGFDRVIRYDGQAFLLFLGDTALSNATSGAERIRQTLEVSTFQVGEEAVDVTASFAVVEARRDESLPELLARLRRSVGEAKNAGRNRTFVDNGGGPAPVKLPQYQVERREIRVEI